MKKPVNKRTLKQQEDSMKRPDYKKVVFVSDIHAPFHDEKAVSACISFVKYWKPTELVFMGDVVDFYAISRFNKDPNRALKLQEELDSAHEILKRFCEVAPQAKKTFLKGNHEARLQKYLWSTAPELANLRSNSVPEQLKLNELGIEYIENGKITKNGCVIKHGNIVRKFAGYSAKGEFENCGISGVSAHTHRLGQYYHTHEGGMFTWIECGCLCDMNAEYMEGKVANWQHGFGIGFYKNSGSTRFNTTLVPIVNGKAMWGGKEFF